MLVVEESVLIHRSRHQVWRYLIDPARFTSWMRNAVEYDADWEHEPQVGDTYRILEKVAGRRIEATAEITAVVARKHYTSQSVKAPFPVENTFRLEDVGDDTRLIYHGETPGFGGFFGKLSGPIMVRIFSRDMRANLATLKSLVESS